MLRRGSAQTSGSRRGVGTIGKPTPNFLLKEAIRSLADALGQSGDANRLRFAQKSLEERSLDMAIFKALELLTCPKPEFAGAFGSYHEGVRMAYVALSSVCSPNQGVLLVD